MLNLEALLESAGAKQMAEIISYYNKASKKELDELFFKADEKRRLYYGRKVFFRGLIEFSNYCKNDCYYCGIRCSNKNTKRYRLSAEEIMECCAQGYALGFRSFVLQSGEDPYYTEKIVVGLIKQIKGEYPDCALTLSLGEKDREVYQSYFKAGADRYLLRHESANQGHYARLHPQSLTLAKRMECLYALKEIGFQVGAGFMVQSPYQTLENLGEDLVFLREFKPHMIGIGPFIPHCDTIFAGEETPDSKLTLILLALVRIMLPKVLMPSTTALGTIEDGGREMGLEAGANVVMPNLSPVSHRKEYAIYDNKICMDEEAAEGVEALSAKIIAAGFEPDFSRGDYIDFTLAEQK